MKNDNQYRIFQFFFLFTLIASFLTVAGCNENSTIAAPKSAEKTPVKVNHPPLKVKAMTFNIRNGMARDGANHWSKRTKMVYDVFTKYNADFVGVQEAYLFQAHEINKALPTYHMSGIRTRDVDPAKDEACPIYYHHARWKLIEAKTFWYSDTPEKPGSNGWGNRLARIITWARFESKKTGQGIYVFNTHYDHVSQPSRVKASKMIAKLIAEREVKSDPYVVLGDFNAAENNPAITFLKSKAGGSMVDTFRVINPDAKEVKTAHSFRGTRVGGKIDYVFVPPTAKTLSAKIIYDNIDGRYPSDHYPVIGEFVLKMK